MGLKEQTANRKAQITKKLKLIRDLDRPGVNINRMWTLLHEAEAKLDELYDLYDEMAALQTLEVDTKAILEEKIRATDEYTAKCADVCKLLLARETSNSPSSTSPPNIRSRDDDERSQFKPISDMKPFILTSESEPFEMRNWIGKFKAYFKASNAKALDLGGRISLFKNFLTSDLCVVIENALDKATSVEACYTILENHFLQIKPLFTRRLALFRIMKEKRPFKDFVADVRRKAREAELSSMTVDQLLVFLVMAGTREEKALFAKLRELKNPDLNDLIEQAADFEGIIRDTDFATKPASLCGPTLSAEAILSAVAANCRGCGYPHNRDACPFRDRPCFACGKVGHIKNLCRNRSPSGSPTTRGRPKERGRRGSPGVRYNGESSRSPSVVRINTIRARSAGMDFIKVIGTDQAGHPFILNALPDSGAARTVIPPTACPRDAKLTASNTRLRAANGTSLRNFGKFEFNCQVEDGPTARVSAAVSPDIVDALIGKKDLITLGILPPDFPAVHHCITEPTVINTVEADNVEKDPLSPDRVIEIEKAISRIEGTSHNNNENIRQFLFNSADVMVTSLGDAAGSMIGGPMTIELDENKTFKPYHVTTARSVPIHHEAPASDLCQELIQAGMMTRCPEPTEWCAQAHFVPKPTGKVRLVIDYRKLNQATKRPVHPFSSVPDLMHQVLPQSRWFAKLDAVHGYFQIPLDKKSSFLCAFLLPDGKYRPLVAPMGWKGSGDVFSLRTDLAFEELKRKKWILKIVDDICVQAVTLPELLDRLAIIIQICRNHGIKLSISKFDIGQSVKFAGFIVSSSGMRPDPNKLSALGSFPTPKSVSDLRSFLGLANQLGAFVPDLQHSTVKMRELLKKSSAWLWLPDHEAEFCKAKTLLTSPAVVQPFDPSLQTQLLTDASRLRGLGFALIQRERSVDGKGKIRLVQCGSCSLTAAQKNYATIELELSAIWFAVQKCAYYLRGMPQFEIITDHRPLLGIFEQPLASLNNTRLQRLRENLDQFSFSVTWTAGKNHLIADALSRFPVFAADPSLEVALCAAVSVYDPAFTTILRNIDEEYGKLRSCIEHDHPLPRTLSPYGEVAGALRIGEDAEKGLIMLGDRIVVPRPARRMILELLHLSHSGITKTTELAKQLYYWPGMRNEIELWIRRCSVCVRSLSCQTTEPVLSAIEIATAPMEAVSADLFDLEGKTFLVMADRFSGFPFVSQMASLSTDAVWRKMRTWFHDFGFPRRIKTDGGPQFRQRFIDTCSEFHIMVETSSPYNPRSNGLAEAAVKQVKGLLKKMNGIDGTEFRAALLEWRATPRADGHSPATGFFGRNLRTRLPSAKPLDLKPELRSEFRSARRAADQVRVDNAGGHTLPPLARGERVHVQHPVDKEWSFEAGIVTDISPSGRSYTVETGAGQYLRNRRFLRPAPSRPPAPPQPMALTTSEPNVLDPSGDPRPPHPKSNSRLRRSKRNLRVRFDV